LLFLASGKEVHRTEMYFAALLQVIDKYPGLAVKITELVANLARQGEL